jgi:hypothetical protein
MSSLSREIILLVLTMVVNLVAVVLGVAVSREWSRRAVTVALVAVVLVNGGVTLIQLSKVRNEHAKEAAILTRKDAVVKLLGDELDKASGIEYRLESLMTRRTMTQEALDGFVGEIDKWRTRVGADLERLLPGTYAARVFLSARGEFPGAFVFTGPGATVGFAMTPGFYQYSHVRECRAALTAILASVDSFARLSADLK